MNNILDEILFLIQRFTWSSVLDILLVTSAFGLILWLLRDTEALVLLRGVFLIVILLGLLTSVVNLPAFSWLINTITPALIIAIPVIFAPEIRRTLQRVGSASNLNIFRRKNQVATREETENMIQAVVKASVRLSDRHHGALITIQRATFLSQYIRSGVPLGSEVTPELLLQIFYPNTPLHDGAVIIVDNHIRAASCVLPLSASGVLNRTPDRSMGLRHRAALGISEVSDAISIVVSEETGGISVAHDGHLIRRLDADRLSSALRAFLISNEPLTETNPFKRMLRGLRKILSDQKEEER